MWKKVVLNVKFKNGETRCAKCGTPCQGIKASNGKIYCYNCYNKYIR